MATIFKIVTVVILLIVARFAYNAMTDIGPRDDGATEPVPGHAVGAPPGKKFITNSIGMRLARIPAGEFLMGNPESAESLCRAFPACEPERIYKLDDEVPVHKVRITKAFYLGVHEVTIDQFRQFTEEAPYEAESERDGTGGWGYSAVVRHVVIAPRAGYYASGSLTFVVRFLGAVHHGAITNCYSRFGCGIPDCRVAGLDGVSSASQETSSQRSRSDH